MTVLSALPLIAYYIAQATLYAGALVEGEETIRIIQVQP